MGCKLLLLLLAMIALLIPLNAFAAMLWALGAVSLVGIIVVVAMGMSGIVGVFAYMWAFALDDMNSSSSDKRFKTVLYYLLPATALLCSALAGSVVGFTGYPFYAFEKDGVSTIDYDIISDIVNFTGEIPNTSAFGYVFTEPYDVATNPALWGNHTYRCGKNSRCMACVTPLSFNPGTESQNKTERTAFFLGCIISNVDDDDDCVSRRNGCIDDWFTSRPRGEGVRINNRNQLAKQYDNAIFSRGLPLVSNPITLDDKDIVGTYEYSKDVFIGILAAFNILYLIVGCGLLYWTQIRHYCSGASIKKFAFGNGGSSGGGSSSHNTKLEMNIATPGTTTFPEPTGESTSASDSDGAPGVGMGAGQEDGVSPYAEDSPYA